MDSLKQYLDLYRLNRPVIMNGSAEALNARRDEAYEMLTQSRLPEKGHEGYERTSVNDMMAADYGVNINRVPIPADIAASFRCDVPNMSTLMAVVVNDEFHPTRGLGERLPEGVLFMSLREAARTHRELIAGHYASIAPMTDTAVALNTMLAQDGVLVNIFSSPASLMSARRMLIILGKGAEATLLVCDHTQDNVQQYLSSEVIEIMAHDDSKFGFYCIEESSPETTRHSQLYARQNTRSTLRLGSMTLTCGTTRNEFHIDVPGHNCETLLAGMAIGSGRMHIDNNINLRHIGTHCHSNQLFKYVLDNESTGAFCGRINVTPEADFTDAYQTNRNMLASTSARMHPKPQLEIYNDDVKCSHGATTGQLDHEALFYMRTRGIPEAEARNMLMQAFMADVIDTVSLEGLRDRLRHMVEKRFHGADAACDSCAASCRDAGEKN